MFNNYESQFWKCQNYTGNCTTTAVCKVCKNSLIDFDAPENCPATVGSVDGIESGTNGKIEVDTSVQLDTYTKFRQICHMEGRPYKTAVT